MLITGTTHAHNGHYTDTTQFKYRHITGWTQAQNNYKARNIFDGNIFDGILVKTL